MIKTSFPHRSFRLVCEPEQALLVEALLHEQGFAFEPEPFFPLARRLRHEPFPLGASLAALFGYIYIQDRSSMLPPLALAPLPGAAVLDMCASPGSKTGLLGQLVGPSGFVLGNEPTRPRLATLRRNLQQMNLLCCCTATHPGESLPLLPESWDYIQLDPPCSGWGTVEKNPQVMQLWQGDKVMALTALQRKLLASAATLLAPGGRLVYSTCTTNTEENEEQVRFACEELGLVFSAIEPPRGFAFAPPSRSEFTGVLRVDTGEDGQGFFVALLTKPGKAAEKPQQSPMAPAVVRAEEQGAGFAQSQAPSRPDSLAQGFFVRPWEKESRFVGERRRHGAPGREKREGAQGQELALSALDRAYADTARLPPGRIALFSGTAHFLPEPSRALIPEGFAWKGFVLGKAGAQGALRLNPQLRVLMPEAQEARGGTLINLEDSKALLPLVQGQGLPVSESGGEAGLYYRGLPLCRLAIKGRRAMLPPLQGKG